MKNIKITVSDYDLFKVENGGFIEKEFTINDLPGDTEEEIFNSYLSLINVSDWDTMWNPSNIEIELIGFSCEDYDSIGNELKLSQVLYIAKQLVNNNDRLLFVNDLEEIFILINELLRDGYELEEAADLIVYQNYRVIDDLSEWAEDLAYCIYDCNTLDSLTYCIDWEQFGNDLLNDIESYYSDYHACNVELYI